MGTADIAFADHHIEQTAQMHPPDKTDKILDLFLKPFRFGMTRDGIEKVRIVGTAQYNQLLDLDTFRSGGGGDLLIERPVAHNRLSRQDRLLLGFASRIARSASRYLLIARFS